MIKIPKVKNDCEDTYVCWGHTEFAEYAKDSDDDIFRLLNKDFEVKINGMNCEVRECRESAVPFNRPWPGKQRQLNQTETAGFVSFSADEEVEIRVQRKRKFDTAMIRPLSRKIELDVEGGEVVFKLKEHGQYVLEFGDTHNVLYVFFNQLKEYPEAEKATHYFGPGIHFPGIINLKDDDIIYIDEEAVVFGSLNSLGARNVKIFGGGVLDNTTEERVTEHCYENHTKGTFRIYNCENIDVSDIILTNSSTWVMSMFNCKNVHINNVKIVGQWRYNTDGIDIVNSENVLVENCFIRSFDDTISIKAIYDYSNPIQNITVDNCVMWCGWGKNCEIGVETAGIEYKNIVFRNCDLIHNSVGAMCISNGCYADIHHILFENINVEFQSNTLVERVQREDAQIYDSKGETMPAALIRNYSTSFSIRKKDINKPTRIAYKKKGDIHDIVYNNINIYTDNMQTQPIIYIGTNESDKKFKNFQFNNIFKNGVKVESFDEFETTFVNVENVTIN